MLSKTTKVLSLWVMQTQKKEGLLVRPKIQRKPLLVQKKRLKKLFKKASQRWISKKQI
jgi:hypothetical protein